MFVSHPALHLGPTRDVLGVLGGNGANAILLIDPVVDPVSAIRPFQHLELEKIVCSIDLRLSCGDANQLAARCAPRNLMLPVEYTYDPNPANPTNRCSGLPVFHLRKNKQAS